MMDKVHLFPVLVFLLFQVTFIVCYIAAVLQGHVVPTVPYISDAGTYSPESCVFGQLLNIGAVLLGITVYIRYRQVLELYSHHPEIGAPLLKYNRLSIYCGIISCLGISIVGNFQETNVKFVHFAGAFLCFGFGTLYFWLQACVSYMLQPMSGTKRMAHVRLGMAVCCAILFIVQTVTGLISHILYKGLNPRKWYPSDGGWHLHVVSCICEWTVSTLYCFYILTFTDEFREMEIDHPPVTLQPYRVTL